MTSLADWLHAQMQERGLTQAALSARAGIGLATLNEILTKDHIPKIDTLFRLADALDTDHLDILFISGHLRRASDLPGADTAGQERPDLTWQLIQEFRRIPRELQSEALAALQPFLRLAKRPRPNPFPDPTQHR